MEVLTIATVTARGYHRWPDAPDNRAYLRTMHPHNFRFQLVVRVTDPDRQYEFHNLQDSIAAHLWMKYGDMQSPSGTLDFGSSSCEQIAISLAQLLRHDSANIDIASVSVWEDDDVGGVVEFDSEGL